MAWILFITAAMLGWTAGLGYAGELPATATKASMTEFQAMADGKTVKVEIFDLGVPVTATLVWNWRKKVITGKALVDGKKTVNVKTRLSFDGDKACAKNEGKMTCHSIFIDGDSFFEVRDDNVVHAKSTLVK